VDFGRWKLAWDFVGVRCEGGCVMRSWHVGRGVWMLWEFMELDRGCEGVGMVVWRDLGEVEEDCERRSW
jgi:hypothetical protein